MLNFTNQNNDTKRAHCDIIEHPNDTHSLVKSISLKSIKIVTPRDFNLLSQRKRLKVSASSSWRRLLQKSLNGTPNISV